MSTYTYKTTFTWNSEDEQLLAALEVDRADLLSRLSSEEKTDGISERVSPTVTIRKWVDAAAAQEFVDGMAAIAAAHNATIISAEISPLE